MLPPLIDVIPEARLNLVIYYLKQGTCYLQVFIFTNNIPVLRALAKDREFKNTFKTHLKLR